MGGGTRVGKGKGEPEEAGGLAGLAEKAGDPGREGTPETFYKNIVTEASGQGKEWNGDFANSSDGRPVRVTAEQPATPGLAASPPASPCFPAANLYRVIFIQL